FAFFFQAEDGIRDFHVTGVQTCALPILLRSVSGGRPPARMSSSAAATIFAMVRTVSAGCLPTLVSPESITASVPSMTALATSERSEGRRVGEGAACRRAAEGAARDRRAA